MAKTALPPVPGPLTEIDALISDLMEERRRHEAEIRVIDRNLHQIRLNIGKLIGGDAPPPVLGSGRRRKMTPEGLANVRAAIKRRWARVRAEKRAELKAAKLKKKGGGNGA